VPVSSPKAATPKGLASPAYIPRGIRWAKPASRPAGVELPCPPVDDPGPLWVSVPVFVTWAGTGALSDLATNVMEARRTTNELRTTHAHQTR